MPTMPVQHALECRAFLKELRRTANAKLSADTLGIPFQRFHHRRRTYPAFAAEWRAAVAIATARLAKGGVALPEGETAKSQGGEYQVSSARSRAFQVKRARKGIITAAGERMFLETLAATANVRLACDTVGVSDGAIYLRRKHSQAFADRMDAALDFAIEHLELAMIEGATGGLDPAELEPDWLEGACEQPPPLSRMTFNQAAMVLGMHYKQVHYGEKRRPHNRKPVTAAETDAAIMALLGPAGKRADAAAARNARMAARGGCRGRSHASARRSPRRKPTRRSPTCSAVSGSARTNGRNATRG